MPLARTQDLPASLAVGWAALSTALSVLVAAPIDAQEGNRPEPVRVTFEGTGIEEVVAFFADYAGRSIVLGSGVSGTVTAEIERQPWDVALQAILSAQGLYGRELSNGIVLVESPGTPAEASKTVTTRVFRLSFVTAAELQPAVQSMLSEAGSVSVLASINALVVTDATDVLERVARLLR